MYENYLRCKACIRVGFLQVGLPTLPVPLPNRYPLTAMEIEDLSRSISGNALRLPRLIVSVSNQQVSSAQGKQKRLVPDSASVVTATAKPARAWSRAAQWQGPPPIVTPVKRIG